MFKHTKFTTFIVLQRKRHDDKDIFKCSNRFSEIIVCVTIRFWQWTYKKNHFHCTADNTSPLPLKSNPHVCIYLFFVDWYAFTHPVFSSQLYDICLNDVWLVYINIYMVVKDPVSKSIAIFLYKETAPYNCANRYESLKWSVNVCTDFNRPLHS